jgi:hypothetical protein
MTDAERQERKARATAMALRAADPILNLRKAAAYLGFKDPQTLSGLAQRGTVTAAKKCGRWSFRKSWLDEFHDVTCRYVTKAQTADENQSLFGGKNNGVAT